MATKKTFDSMINELEEIVATLEQGDQPLEQMIKLYNEGVKLTALCKAKLDAAATAIDSNEEND